MRPWGSVRLNHRGVDICMTTTAIMNGSASARDNSRRSTRVNGGKRPRVSGPNGRSAMAAKATKGRRAAKRELIDAGHGKRYVRRDQKGRFDEVDNQSRSLSQDRRHKAQRVVKAGQGDKGDQRRR